MSLYSEVMGLIGRRGLLEGVRTVVVGLSGGADSVCLLDLLALMAERGDIKAAVHAAHLNHGLRGAESDADERFARELAEKSGLPITVERRDVNAARADAGGSLEEAARRERYSFLASVAAKTGAQAVAVGHNADDQVETVMHRMIRGAGLRGLCGMPLTRPLLADTSLQGVPGVRLIRPLLRARRREIIGHLRERGLAFREDSSNLDTAFLRNRIRNELIPLIESGYNTAFGESLLRLSRSAADVCDLLLDLAHSEAELCVAGETLDVKRFRLAHPAVRPLLIDAAATAIVPVLPQFNATHYEAVSELALRGKPGDRVDLPGGIAAIRSENAITFATASPNKHAPSAAVEAVLNVPGETAVAGFMVKATLVDPAAFDLNAFLRTKTRYDEVVDFDAVPGPLLVRSRRDGDVFQPLGSAGRKKVGDFLTDLKLPADERDRVLIVAAGEQPVWIVGFRIDDCVKVTPQTKRLLRLSVEPFDGAQHKPPRQFIKE